MSNDPFDRMMQSQQARAKNLRKWRASRLHEETLPSGLEVLLRDVDISTLAIDSDIPNTLMDLITSDEFQKLSEDDAGRKVLENKADFNTFLKTLVKAVMVEPEIGEKPDDGHVLYSELSLDDRMFIFNFLNREATDLRPFRDETTEPDPAAQPGGSLQEHAERDPGDGNGLGRLAVE